MAFKKGDPRPENAGRKEGTVNKVTQEAREAFKLTLEGQVSHLPAAFDYVRETDPAKYLELIAKYAQYFVPKMVAVELNQNVFEVEVKDEK